MQMVKKTKKQTLRARYCRIYDAAFIILLTAALAAMIWFMINSTSFMLFGNIVTHVNTKEKVVALTFDDGPLPIATEDTLATLKQYGVKATFFVIGVEATRHMDQLKEIIAEGHEVGNHSYSHKYMAFMMPGDIANEIEKNDKLIRQAGYAGPIPFRTPYNAKFITLPFYLMQHQRPDISRDVVTKEGWSYSADVVARDVIKQVKPGSIILLHPMYKHTAGSRKAIAKIITDLRAEGYKFVTVSQLLTYKKT
jgi:chitin deacetylase